MSVEWENDIPMKDVTFVVLAAMACEIIIAVEMIRKGGQPSFGISKPEHPPYFGLAHPEQKK